MPHWPLNMPTKPMTLTAVLTRPAISFGIAAREDRVGRAPPRCRCRRRRTRARASCTPEDQQAEAERRHARRRPRAAAARCGRAAARHPRRGRRRGSPRSSRALTASRPRATSAGLQPATSRSQVAIHSVCSATAAHWLAPTHTARRRNAGSRSSRAEAAQLLGERLALSRRAPLGHPQPQHQAHRQVRRDDQQERLAPAPDAQQHLERHGDRDRADRARGERDAVHGRDALGRVPEHERGERGHQAGRDAEADQRARRDRRGGGLRQREPDAARGGDEQQRGVDAARAEAVERDARAAAGTTAKARK